MIKIFYGIYIASERFGEERVGGHTDLGELQISYDREKARLVEHSTHTVIVKREEWDGMDLKKAELWPMS